MAGVESWFAGVVQYFSIWCSRVAVDFNANLVKDDRYMLMLHGLGVTILVAVTAAILGIVLGSLIALMRLSKWKILRGISSAYVDVIRGTPAVTQLMIMNFIILASYRGPQALIAILTFGLNSAAYVSEMVRGGILAIDKGQTEAGRSLGLSTASTMLLIVMPQAVKVIIPSLFNEFIMLMKETSIVGFIGLMDLQKAGDYIRSLTYSAFFPLITVAVVYFVIISLLTRLFNRLERRLRQGDIR